ncbi:RraA family protein [Tenuibacillus multivorans]|uniref:Putative 4-hydroxy-4-methyl-2-oxoglutarate aldolase n=1 Tax=Tenuibacillus multivorans TaxID=237069 RepID=A0A1H0BXT7_9BACI|nr:RraA family protein [Tenuibacillus multivorans]GEL78563.1 diguanylate cyclase [Tenuibacillus multivorans]SDN50422.1 Regulator of RNase E activity RraA [Tenuibacillus multivorans]
MTSELVYPEKISGELIEKLSSLNTTLLCDAMDGHGGMDYLINPVTPEMKIVGTAVTVNMRPTDNLFLHKAIYSGRPGYVLVADGKGDTSHAYMGELMARAAKAVGLEGVVIDGTIRDQQGLTELNYPIFSKGFVPNGPYKNGPGNLNTPITCGGVNVNPGDLIFGDSDGVVVVPRDKIESVIEKAEKKLSYEDERIQVISEYEEKRIKGEEPGSIEPNWLETRLKEYR